MHERSVEIDLLLLLLRDVVARRARSPRPLRLVLMSATAEADLFERYIGGAVRLGGLGGGISARMAGRCGDGAAVAAPRRPAHSCLSCSNKTLSSPFALLLLPPLTYDNYYDHYYLLTYSHAIKLLSQQQQ